MTIALFLLAAAGSCATPTPCPTAKEIMAAIYRYRRQYSDQLNAEDPLVMRAPSRILGLSDVICGDALPGAARSMNCKYTVRYADSRSYDVATFVRRNGKWVLTDEHALWRKE